MCACAASYAEGTSNDTELETLKERLQFETLAGSCFVLSGTQRPRGIMCRARGYADTCAVSHGGVGHRRRGGR
jgi:hypothetical protein